MKMKSNCVMPIAVLLLLLFIVMKRFCLGFAFSCRLFILALGLSIVRFLFFFSIQSFIHSFIHPQSNQITPIYQSNAPVPTLQNPPPPSPPTRSPHGGPGRISGLIIHWPLSLSLPRFSYFIRKQIFKMNHPAHMQKKEKRIVQFQSTSNPPHQPITPPSLPQPPPPPHHPRGQTPPPAAPASPGAVSPASTGSRPG